MPRDENSSLPMHIGQTIVSGLLQVKSEIGVLAGKMDGVQNTLADINARVSHTVTREECIATHAQFKSNGKRSSSTGGGYPAISAKPRRESWWTITQQRVSLVIAFAVLLTLIGGAALWMADAYKTIQEAQAALLQNKNSNKINKK